MDEQATTEQTESTSHHRPYIRLVITSLVIIVAAALLVTFGLWRYLDAEKQALSSHNQALSADVQSAKTQLTLLKRQVADEMSRQQADLSRLNQALQDMNKQRQDKSQDFLMSEAYYFLRLANYTLQFERNVPMALQLLRMADDSLKQAGSAPALALRQTINDNIASLNTVPRIDTENLYLQLDTLGKQIETLPLKKPSSHKSKVRDENGSWYSSFKHSMHTLKGLVVIRRNDEFAKSRLSPQAIDQLYHGLELHLSTAQYAVLQKQNAIYHAAIAQVILWANEYLDTEAPATIQFLAQCNELKRVNLNPVIPTLAIPSDPAVQAPAAPTMQTTPASTPIETLAL